MEQADPPHPEPWIRAIRAHARIRPYMTLGFILALVAMVGLAAQNLGQLLTGDTPVQVRLALLGGAAGLAATALGGLPVLGLRSLPRRTEDILLAASAGMMLAASCFFLILPGLRAAGALTGRPGLGALTVVAGMGLGVLLMLGLDGLTPHAHEQAGAFGPGHERYGQVGLFVFAIALHNLPEGMALGAGFARGDLGVGIPLTLTIALQDLLEGLVVAMALRGAGLSPWAAVGVSAATGLLEVLGALVGVTLSSAAPAYPIGLGLAAGAMLFVVSHEVIPETHRNGHQTPATLALLAGFALVMTLGLG